MLKLWFEAYHKYRFCQYMELIGGALEMYPPLSHSKITSTISIKCQEHLHSALHRLSDPSSWSLLTRQFHWTTHSISSQPCSPSATIIPSISQTTLFFHSWYNRTINFSLSLTPISSVKYIFIPLISWIITSKLAQSTHEPTDYSLDQDHLHLT